MQDLPLWLRKRVSAAYIPGCEFFLSLHVLANPDHHTSRIGWARETLHALPAGLARDLRRFDALSNHFLNVLDFLSPWEETYHHSVEAGLERVQAMSPEEFAEAMMGPVSHRRQLQAWMRGHTDEAFEQLKPEHRELIRRPLAAKRDFLDFCYAYLPFFQAEERRIEPWLIRAVHEAAERLAADPVSFLSRVHPRLHVHERFLQFHKAKTYQFAYEELTHIYLIVSTFAAPHLLLGVYADRITVGLHVDVPGTAEKAAIPADFIAKMKVFSDPTRAAILKSLLGHPYCVQQLAALHGISEPAVVKHIKLLADAGFVWSERRGRYVFYRAMPSRLEQLAVDLHEFIDMPDAGLPAAPSSTERRK
jgi:DNA-binding transcriptional ArsR family regulator